MGTTAISVIDREDWPPKDRISWLKRKLLLAPEEFAICPHVGLSENGTELDNGSSLDQQGLHSSSSQCR